MKLLEVKKSQLVSRSRSNPRFNRRLRSKVSNNTRDYQLIDMNKLFKKDILEVGLPVKGETDDYVVTISYEGVIATLKQYLKTDKLELRLVVKALVSNFNNKDVFINCNCKDFCLVGNTKIKLLDGRTLTIEEIVELFNNGEDLWTYSSDSKGDFKPGKITNAWLTKHVDKTILVELDNGSVVETTPEHLFMLRDGTYVEAQHLEPNTSLMPMYLRTGRKGYEQVRLNSTPIKSDYRSTYKLVASTLKQREITETLERLKGEDTYAIHHVDFIKSNNSPSNLRIMGKLEHYKYHSDHVFESGSFDKMRKASKKYWKTKEAKQKQSKVWSYHSKKYWAQFTPEERSEIVRASRENIDWEVWGKNHREGRKRFFANMTPEERLEYTNKNINAVPESKENRLKQSNTMKVNYSKMTQEEKDNHYFYGMDRKGVRKTSAHREKISEKHFKLNKSFRNNPNRVLKPLPKDSRVKTVLNKIMIEGQSLTPDNYLKYKNEYPFWENYFLTWDDVIKHFQLEEYNHKVKSVKVITHNKAIPVYDIEIPEWHNFRVDTGVMVHNSYRFNFWSTVNRFNANNPEMRPSKITNPDDNLGSTCKHGQLILNNTGWALKVASVINNYIKFMKLRNRNLYDKIISPALYDVEPEEDINKNQLSIFDEEPVEEQPTKEQPGEVEDEQV